LTISILKYAREINQFIEQSAAFDKAFLSGSYGNCKTILYSIMHGLGPSLWVMEKQFLLRETVEGLEANKSFLSELSKETANDPILKFLGNYASTRAETKLSPENYRLMLSKGLNLDDRFAAIRSYFQYRLDHVGIDQRSEYSLLRGSFAHRRPLFNLCRCQSSARPKSPIGEPNRF
jgi:hypothetical protein